jgi:hypothetical protein
MNTASRRLPPALPMRPPPGRPATPSSPKGASVLDRGVLRQVAERRDRVHCHIALQIWTSQSVPQKVPRENRGAILAGAGALQGRSFSWTRTHADRAEMAPGLDRRTTDRYGVTLARGILRRPGHLSPKLDRRPTRHFMQSFASQSNPRLRQQRRSISDWIFKPTATHRNRLQTLTGMPYDPSVRPKPQARLSLRSVGRSTCGRKR